MFAVLFAAIHKELLNLSRDLHGLLLLFIMPAVFILIMSLALKGDFDSRGQVTLAGAIVSLDQGESGELVLSILEQHPNLAVERSEPAQIQALTENDQRQFGVIIPASFSDDLQQAEVQQPVALLLGPSVTPQLRLLIAAAVKEALARARLELYLEELSAPQTVSNELIDAQLLKVTQAGARADDQQPSAVQQSVPAWLIFSMFFVVIPLSTTVIEERQQGTLMRLRTLPISAATILMAKLLPYCMVNLIQMVIMMAVGAFLVPALGGDALSLAVSWPALVMMTVAISFAAVSYALLLSTIARTTEQATTIGGVGNLLLGALGGIMVPKFVMPQAMQQATLLSPMNWGLEGYLSVLLRGGGIHDILLPIAALALLGALLLGIATYRMKQL